MRTPGCHQATSVAVYARSSLIPYPCPDSVSDRIAARPYERALVLQLLPPKIIAQ